MQDRPKDKEPLYALDLCNMALEKLGEKRIPGINPCGSPASRLCYMHYHPVRREVLCATRWSFATKKAEMTLPTPETDKPSFFVFGLPNDTLRVLECSAPDWSLRGRSIYTAEPYIALTYIADVEDTRLFEPLFVEAFATRLACKLCIPLTASTTTRHTLVDEYQRIYDERRQDA